MQSYNLNNVLQCAPPRGDAVVFFATKQMIMEMDREELINFILGVMQPIACFDLKEFLLLRDCSTLRGEALAFFSAEI